MKTVPFDMFALCVFASFLLVEGTSKGGGQTPKSRQTAVAGTFYPADPAELGKMIDGYLACVLPALASGGSLTCTP